MCGRDPRARARTYHGATARGAREKERGRAADPCAAIFAIGGGAGWYFKIYRPQHQQAAAPEDDYEEEMDAYNDFEDDGPPWDEDDPEPGEEDEA